MDRWSRDENGYIVVETVGSFLLFTLLIVSILSLINIIAVQARVHYALTETAKTISMYSYVLDVTGAADFIMDKSAKSEKVITESNKFKGDLNNFLGQLDKWRIPGSLDDVEDMANTLDPMKEDLDAMIQKGKNTADYVRADPKGAVQILLAYGFDESLNEVSEWLLIRPLMNHYLKNGSLSGGEFLSRFRVSSGLEAHSFDLFDLKVTGDTNSRLLDSKGNVKLVVEYDIDYTFGALPVPFAKLHVTQEAITKAWLGGFGKGYEG